MLEDNGEALGIFLEAVKPSSASQVPCRIDPSTPLDAAILE
jgi:hypothetical protein